MTAVEPCFQAFSWYGPHVAYDSRESEESMNPTKRKPQRLAFTVARLERLQPPEPAGCSTTIRAAPGFACA